MRDYNERNQRVDLTATAVALENKNHIKRR